MNPFDYMQTWAQLWARSTQGLAAAQPSVLPDGVKALGLAAAFFDPQGLASAKDGFDKLLSSANGISQAIARSLERGEKVDPVVVELIGKLLDPRAWLSSLGGMDEALQRMAEGPRLADVWDNERKLLSLFTAWTALRQRSVEHYTLMLQAWMRAAGAFAKTLNEKAERRETLGSWREILAVWVDTANTALLETQRSDSYLQSQREILKASTDLRLAQQDIAGFYSEVFGYPGRAELDDVHRTVTELRRELRALKRAIPAAATERRESGKEDSGKDPVSSSMRAGTGGDAPP